MDETNESVPQVGTLVADATDEDGPVPSTSKTNEPPVTLAVPTKRRHSDGADGEGQQIKRKATDTASTSAIESGPAKRSSASICGLSDEVLLNILKYLDSASLLSFGETCNRFQPLVSDYCLWYDFDFSSKPMSAKAILNCFRHLSEKTRSFRVAGLRSLYPASKSNNITLTKNMLEKLCVKCPQLRHMSVIDAMMDIEGYTIHNFPAGITSLTLHNCESNALSRTFFNRIENHLLHLTELRLENCSWFETHTLIALSKLPQLTTLSLRGCQSLKECVPYGSVATRFGFQKLTTLDIRDTPISDSEVQCFNITQTLRHLLMEFPKDRKDDVECRYCENISVANSASTSSSSPSSPSSSSSSSSSSASSSAANPAPFQCARHRTPAPVQNAPPSHVINVVVDVGGQNLVAQPPEFLNPFAVQQQLIIVRNVQVNENGLDNARRHRLAWEVVYDQDLANQYGVFNTHGQRRHSPYITDRGICSFGRTRRNLQPNMVWIRAEQRMSETLLETLVVRGYKGVTDISLRHLAECAPNLHRLDVTGTAVTAEGVNVFRAAKPACLVITDTDAKSGE